MHLSTALVVLTTLLPSIVFAGTLDDSAQNASSFEDILQQMQEEQNVQAEDAVREAGAEVFPSGGKKGSSVSSSSAPAEDPYFLTARVDGVPVVFRDVPKEEWFAPYVREVTGRGIVSGYRESDGTPRGLYGPADALTVEQLAKLAVQLAQVDGASCGTALRNGGAKERWSEPFIRCAEQRGWAVFADGSVDVQRSARRAEVVATLLQALAVKIEARTGGFFTDVDSSVEFAAAIEMAARAGVITGDSDAQGDAKGTFRPADAVNRAEVAKIITRVMQVFGK